MDKAIVTELLEAIATEASEMAKLYADVLKRLGWEELKALWDLIKAGERRTAEAELRRWYTNDELVEEKRLLTDSAQKLADDQAKGIQIARELGWTVLKAIIGTLVGAALL